MTIPNANPKKPEWAPRLWEGCSFYAWIRLLVKNRAAVHWGHLYIAVIVTFNSLLHSLLGFVQTLLFGWAIRKTKLQGPPIFILGHWRNGTTFLHELMIQDPRHGFPTTYECMDPSHFLLTENFFRKYFSWLMPKSRPMDNMKAGFERPQEDEFALCMLGYPSPYLTIAFPNHPPQDSEYLDLENVSPRALASWKKGLFRFLQCITYKSAKRLVLKSPTHTARIKVLREMFPDAIFIHIVRNPYIVFPSTVNLWRTLYRCHGLQTPTYDGLEDQVFETYLRMHRALEEGKKLLGPEQFHELRYEDLVRDPIGEIRKIYDHFSLSAFEEAKPHLERYLASIQGYETNRYQFDPALLDRISERWRVILDRYPYDRPTLK